MDSYEIIEKIGQGRFGTVFKARQITSAKIVAVKRIQKKARLIELSLQKVLKHPNVMPLLKVVREKRFDYLVMEFFPMDLYDQLRRLPAGTTLPPELIKRYLYQISKAVDYCHQKGYMHRDLKPSNILVNLQGVIKVADFGLACFYGAPKFLDCTVGTRIYKAPEILLGSKVYYSPVDIWAIGCIFAEMAMAELLFSGKHDIIVLYDIFGKLGSPTEDSWPGITSLPFNQVAFPCWTNNKLAKRMTSLDETGLDLLQKCLQYNPADRLTAKEILEHKYFDGFEKSTIATN